MDFSLDDAEAAFLQDILTGAEAANGAGFGSGSTTDYPRSTLLPNSGHAAPNSATSGPQEDSSPSAPPSARTSALLSVTGRPPRPRNGPQVSLSPKGRTSVGPPGADATSWQQRLPRQPLEHTYPDPHQQQQPQHRNLATGTPATRSTLSPLQLVPTRQPSDPSCGGGGSGATVVSRPRPAGASPYTTSSAASPPRAQPPPPPPTAVAAASVALPATTSSTSGSSEASSNTSAGEQHRCRNSNSSSNGSRRFCSNAALVCTAGTQPADIADPPNPSTGPAVLPSRRARGVLQRISTLEVQLQQMLLAEGEAAGSPPLLAGGAAPGAPDPTAPPLGQSDPRVLQQQRSQQGPYERTARAPRQPLVFAVAEQLCRDYNSSGVALMEAGLDEAARQQLDKALLLAGPGGPLEGRTNKQREMQIVAHNNLACYYRKLKQAGMALEHLQQAAGLETAAAADGADGADAAVCSGPTAATLLNMAACCSSLGQHGQALSYAAQAVPAAAVELQVPLVPLESALLQGLPQVKLWDVLPQLRRADPGATTQLAMSYYNRAVEQEHMHQWQPALESYRLAVDVASRFAGRGDGLTQTMHQSAEAFKVRLRNLERQGKLRGRGASAAFTLAAAASSSQLLVSSSSANSRHPHSQPRPLRCTSSASTTAPVSTTNPTAPHRRILGLPAINRPASTPLGRETSATSTALAGTGARAHSAGPAAPSAPPRIAPLASSAPEPAVSPWAPQTQLLTRSGPDADGRPIPGIPPLLRDLSFSLAPGSTCLLLGANGAGKTSFLKVLAGKHMVSEDQVRILGRPPFHDTQLTVSGELSYIGGNWQRDIAFAGTSVPLTGDFPASYMIDSIPGVDPERKARLIKVLDIDVSWRMHTVSDGQRRRVQICVGLLRPFKVLLLDEITVDLDVLGRSDLMRFLKEECETRGSSIIYATHIFDGLEFWPSHLAYLANGQLQLTPASEIPELAQGRLLSLVYSFLNADREALLKVRGPRTVEWDPSREGDVSNFSYAFNNGWVPGTLSSSLSTNAVMRS